ncbi:hypothetical protein RB594_005071 [Gaeumannomyces avenae]
MPEYMRHIQDSQKQFTGNAAAYPKTPAGGNKEMRVARLDDLDTAGRDPVTGAARGGPSQRQQHKEHKKNTADYRNAQKEYNGGVWTDEASLTRYAGEAASGKYRGAKIRDQANPGWLPLSPGQQRAHEAPARLHNPGYNAESNEEQPDQASNRQASVMQSPPPPAQFGKGTRPTHPLWDAQPNADGRINDPATGKPYTAGQPERFIFPAEKQTGRFKGGDENGPNRETMGIHPPTEKDSLTRYSPRPPAKGWGKLQPPSPPATPGDGGSGGGGAPKKGKDGKPEWRPFDPNMKRPSEAPARLPA